LKKLSLYIFLGLLWCNVGYTDDIFEYQIEGISLGDSLLDHLSKEEIANEIEANKSAYNYLTDEFGEVYFSGNFEIYDSLSFFVKSNDKNNIIYDIRGLVAYDDNIEQCYAKQKEIVEEFSLMYKNTRKEEDKFVFPWDPTGKSHILNIIFTFNSGDAITVSCAEYEKNLKIQNNWEDNLSVSISKKEVMDWMRNHIN
tara:strand:- start:69 stop:662 length:594 start_codon:yes stop_codon:yes gene_type:complete